VELRCAEAVVPSRLLRKVRKVRSSIAPAIDATPLAMAHLKIHPVQFDDFIAAALASITSISEHSDRTIFFMCIGYGCCALLKWAFTGP
jgi:hypothetical protein